MMRFVVPMAAALLIAACDRGGQAPAAAPGAAANSASASAAEQPAPVAPAGTDSGGEAKTAGGNAATDSTATATEPAATASPCLIQGTERLEVAPLRAIGTEPFWGARIEGRCVTYSHPEDQQGTRVWTRFTPGRNGGGTWSGSLGGHRFELVTRPQPGCSDGMSDNVYPIAVDLLVGGERRTGCAEPL
jgi:uncharacterized membrane protein